MSTKGNPTTLKHRPGGPILCQPGDSSSDLSETDNDALDFNSVGLPEDIYAVVLMSSAVDIHHMNTTIPHRPWVRTRRFAMALSLSFVTALTQMSLLFQIKTYITAPAMEGMEETYSTYQKRMYDDTKVIGKIGAVYRTRGNGSFDKNKFVDWDPDKKKDTCGIPLSRPWFMGTILTIWALSCVTELRFCVTNMYRMIVNVKTIRTMAKACKLLENNERIVVGLTRGIKFMVCAFVFVPRVFIATYLLWLGSRWLTATLSFDEVVLNTVALEFIILTKNLMFEAIISQRTREDVKNTKIYIGERLEVTDFNFVSSVGWLVASVAWAALYLRVFQMVLPEYKFDVDEVCEPYLDKRYDLNLPFSLFV